MPDRDRPDETPATIEELRPPGYYSAMLGRFVGVHLATPEEAEERYEQMEEWFAGTQWSIAEKFRRR